MPSPTVIVPRDEITTVIQRLTAAAISAEERGMVYGAQAYRQAARVLQCHLDLEPLTHEEQAAEAGRRA